MSMDRRQLATVRVARALGDPTRFLLLRAISGREEISCLELTRRSRLAQATVSHHLKVLADAGLVSARREGPYHYYRLHRDVLAAHGATLAAAFAGRGAGGRLRRGAPVTSPAAAASGSPPEEPRAPQRRPAGRRPTRSTKGAVP
jgi:ArsR family transcriptional regulator